MTTQQSALAAFMALLPSLEKSLEYAARNGSIYTTNVSISWVETIIAAIRAVQPIVEGSHVVVEKGDLWEVVRKAHGPQCASKECADRDGDCSCEMELRCITAAPAIPAGDRVSAIWPKPWRYEPEGFNEGPCIKDDKNQVICAFFWPIHSAEETFKAEQAVDTLAKAIQAIGAGK